MEPATDVGVGGGRKVLIGAAAAVVVIAVAAVWWLAGGGKGGNLAGEKGKEVPMYNGRPVSELYSPNVPASAAPTAAKQVAPASPDTTLTTKARTYDVSASAKGFSPAALTVNEYDTVKINFTAVDGAYDLSIPYLGVNFAPVARGETKLLTFNASGAGTFSFECGSACPAGGKIKGSIVIIPYKAK